MKFYYFKTENYAPIDVVSAFHDDPYCLFFDSAAPSHPDNRYSYVLFQPQETIEYKNGTCSITTTETAIQNKGVCPFTKLRERLHVNHHDYYAPKSLPPFHGGAAGFFGYDLGRMIEDIGTYMPHKNDTDTNDENAIPDMAVGIYHQLYAYDHHKQQGWFFIHALNSSIANTRMRFFENAVAHSDNQQSHKTNCTPIEQWTSSHTKESYMRDTRRVIDYIYAGDIFQANLSQRFETRLPDSFHPFDHYKILRDINAAPFAAYMNFGNLKIASSSPERFLSVAADNKVETKPIKGTMKRSHDPAQDAAIADKLRESAKDNAENAMIVDLMRNDLSRTCIDSSIDVPKLCALESFAKVHHLVSTVTGQLRPDQHPVDLLKSCFPGGSITGAPKIRAMEIIDELEGTPRGPYCGSMGYIGFNGTMDTNIAIRTLVYHDDKARFNVGGGVVADSDPMTEYQETLDKANAIFKSFEKYNQSIAHRKKAA